MGRKAQEKDIDFYTWQESPKQRNKLNNNWSVRYGYVDSTGKERQGSESFSVNEIQEMQQFQNYISQKIKEHKKKGKQSSEKEIQIRTVRELLLAYAEYAKACYASNIGKGWSHSTYKSYLGLMENYIFPKIGEEPIYRITKDSIENFYIALAATLRVSTNHTSQPPKLVSDRMKVECNKILSRAFRWACNTKHIISDNPMRDIHLPVPKSKRREVWPEDTMNHALAICDNECLKTYLYCALTTSAREGELLALTWDDLYIGDNIEHPYVRIYKSISYADIDWIESTHERNIFKVFDQVNSTSKNPKRRSILKTTKTNKQQDILDDRIYISFELAILLQEHHEIQKQQKETAGSQYHDNNLIFAQENGDPIHPALMERRFKKFCVAKQLPIVTIYSMRHLSITLKLNLNGHDYVSTARDSGHKNVSTMQIYYETPEDCSRIHTVNALGKRLSPVSSQDDTVIFQNANEENISEKFRRLSPESQNAVASIIESLAKNETK